MRRGIAQGRRLTFLESIPERCHERTCVGKAFVRILRERPLEDPVDPVGQPGIPARCRRHRLVDVRCCLGGLGTALERAAAREELVADDAEPVAVARRRCAVPERLLGCQVAGRSEHRARDGHSSGGVVRDAGDAEVRDGDVVPLVEQ